MHRIGRRCGVFMPLARWAHQRDGGPVIGAGRGTRRPGRDLTRTHETKPKSSAGDGIGVAFFSKMVARLVFSS